MLDKVPHNIYITSWMITDTINQSFENMVELQCPILKEPFIFQNFVFGFLNTENNVQVHVNF